MKAWPVRILILSFFLAYSVSLTAQPCEGFAGAKIDQQGDVVYAFKDNITISDGSSPAALTINGFIWEKTLVMVRPLLCPQTFHRITKRCLHRLKTYG